MSELLASDRAPGCSSPPTWSSRRRRDRRQRGDPRRRGARSRRGDRGRRHCWARCPPSAVGSASPQARAAARRYVGDGAIIGSHSVVNAGAVIGERAYVGDHCLVRKGPRLGTDSSVGRAGTIGRDVVVGDRRADAGILRAGHRHRHRGRLLPRPGGAHAGRPHHGEREPRRRLRASSAVERADRLRRADPDRRRGGREGGRRVRARWSPGTYLPASPWPAYPLDRSARFLPWTCP